VDRIRLRLAGPRSGGEAAEGHREREDDVRLRRQHDDRDDPAGKSKAFTTDSLGRMTLVEEPGGMNTSYEYNSLGQLKTVTMVRGSTTQIRSFSYDSLWAHEFEHHPERGTVTVLVRQNCGHLLGRWFHGR
jgi:YD repeat-containing protein